MSKGKKTTPLKPTLTDFQPSISAREQELETIFEMVGTARHRFAPIVLTGPAGIGKTTLLNQLASKYLEGQVEWLNAKEVMDFSVAKDSRSREPTLLRRLLRDRRRENNVVVILDDADGLSEEFLYPILRAVLNYKIVRGVIVVTRSPIRLRGASTVTLQPLSLSDTAALLTRHLTKQISASSLVRLAEASQGNPLVVQLIVEFLKEHSIDDVWSFLEGEIYNLTAETKLSTKQLVKVVQPQIVLTHDYLIKQLKKYPADIYKVSPRQFEEIIAELLYDKGHDVTLTQQSRDGGKDILAYIDTDLGKLLCLVEAKRYAKTNPVGVGLIRNLYGTLYDYRASSAMLVTTSRFSPDAKEFQKKYPYQLSLQEYSDVVRWINEYKGK